MNSPALPAGLVNDNVEIFTGQDSVAFLQDGIVKPIKLISREIMKRILKEMVCNKKAMAILQKWHKTRPEMLMQYIKCNYGGFDTVPDSDPTGSKRNVECWDCGMKASCNGYGKVCKALVTKKQLSVLSEVATGDPDKQICDRMGITRNTLCSHKRNICGRFGLHSKVEMVRYAVSKRLITL